MSYTIKKINPFAFRTELNAIQGKCFEKAVAKVPLDEGWWWAAFDSEAKLVAYACMRPSQRYKQAAYMSRAGVLKEARGNGLQDKLIRVRLAFAKKAGYSFCVTDTTENPASSNNLADNGFRVFFDKNYGAYPSTITWYKDLINKKTRTSNSPKVL
jgi:GNAT superfamily N-acetyltransferase